jgi:hydroxymethylpyrimidine/phosphomethylpyrimidine kinase
MVNSLNAIPAILSFSGLDPSGSTGIQADIETVGVHGCHALPLITALAVQDSTHIHQLLPISATLLLEQARRVLEDSPVKAIKIGLLGSVDQVRALHTLLRDYPHIPVVIDPLSTHRFPMLLDQDIPEAVRALLFPLATLCIINTTQVRDLSKGADSFDACVHELLAHEIPYILLTGGHEPTLDIVNRLYSKFRLLQDYSWPRLPHVFSGAGTTLAASTVALLAQGLDVQAAVHQAQIYTFECLKRGYRIGMGDPIPNRIYWATGNLNSLCEATKP